MVLCAEKGDESACDEHCAPMAMLRTTRGPSLAVWRASGAAQERPDGLATGTTVGPFVAVVGLRGSKSQ